MFSNIMTGAIITEQVVPNLYPWKLRKIKQATGTILNVSACYA